MPREKKDPRGEPVERYKLTAGQKEFQKNYRKLKRVQSIIEGATLKNMNEAESLAQLWKELEFGFRKLSLTAPQEPTRELSGMNFGEEIDNPNLRINY